MKIETIKNDEKILYPLAKILIRCISSFLDTIILLGIIIGIYYLMKTYSSLSFGEILIISVSIMLIFFFTYHIVIVFFTKGFTLFRWIFKIKLIELIDFKKYFWHLILHDLFIWIHFSLITMILSIMTILKSPNSQENFFTSLFKSNIESDYEAEIIIIKVLYSISAFISICMLVYNCINTGKRSIQDLISWTVMINLNKPTPKNKNHNFAPSKWKQQIESNFHLPGNIDVIKYEFK